MATSYGTAAGFTARFSGPYSGSTSTKIVDITIPKNGWKGAISPYTQAIQVEGVSVSSVVDLSGDSTALETLTKSRCMVYLENEEGTITAVAVGGKPKDDLVLQAMIQEGVRT